MSWSKYDMLFDFLAVTNSSHAETGSVSSFTMQEFKTTPSFYTMFPQRQMKAGTMSTARIRSATMMFSLTSLSFANIQQLPAQVNNCNQIEIKKYTTYSKNRFFHRRNVTAMETYKDIPS